MKIEKFGFEHSDEDIEAKKIEEETTKDDIRRAQEGEQLKEISEGIEKIKVVPMHTWGSEKTIDESFEADAYVIRQEVDGKPRIYVGKDKLHAKQLENWGASAQAANMDIGINDRYEIGPDGKITVYAVHAEQWNPPATWKAKDKLATGRDKIEQIKEKIFKKSDESNQQKDNADSSEVEKQS